MKKTCVIGVGVLLSWVAVAQAQVSVEPYTRKDGTYIDGHYRSNPDGNPYNNWSYPGNTNPYTVRQGTGDPNKYLERYNTHGNSGSSGSGSGSSYNPYMIYRR